jgi:hypothetical protein
MKKRKVFKIADRRDLIAYKIKLPKKRTIFYYASLNPIFKRWEIASAQPDEKLPSVLHQVGEIDIAKNRMVAQNKMKKLLKVIR